MLRKVSHVLTLQYERTIYLLPDTRETRRLIHRYVDVYEYPDGRLEIRSDGQVLPYVPYDRLPEIDQGAIVGNKRLGQVLRVAQIVRGILCRRAAKTRSRIWRGRLRSRMLGTAPPSAGALGYAVPAGTRAAPLEGDDGIGAVLTLLATLAVELVAASPAMSSPPPPPPKALICAATATAIPVG